MSYNMNKMVEVVDDWAKRHRIKREAADEVGIAIERVCNYYEVRLRVAQADRDDLTAKLDAAQARIAELEAQLATASARAEEREAALRRELRTWSRFANVADDLFGAKEPSDE